MSEASKIGDGIKDLGRIHTPSFYEGGYPWETGYEKQLKCYG